MTAGELRKQLELLPDNTEVRVCFGLDFVTLPVVSMGDWPVNLKSQFVELECEVNARTCTLVFVEHKLERRP